MNYQSEVQTAMSIAEGVVRLTMGGVTLMAKGVGKGAGRLVALMYAVLKDNRKTAGKTRIANLLRNGGTIKCFGLPDQQLKDFVETAKKYGILFTVIKDRKSKDGITDILFREEDVARINRIIEKYGLATVERDAELKVTEEPTKDMGEEFKAPESEAVNKAEGVVSEKEAEELMKDISFDDVPGNELSKEKMQEEFNIANDANPLEALIDTKGDPSGPSLQKPKKGEKVEGKNRKSVRTEIQDIKKEMSQAKTSTVGEVAKKITKGGKTK